MNSAAFRAYRDLLGLTAPLCADLLGVQERSVRRWEDGTHRVPIGVEMTMLENEAVVHRLSQYIERAAHDGAAVKRGGKVRVAAIARHRIVDSALSEWTPVADEALESMPPKSDEVLIALVNAAAARAMARLLGDGLEIAVFWGDEERPG